MWQVRGNNVDPKIFKPFEPVEVLYAFDGPKTFTHLDDTDQLCLAHWCEEDDEITRFLVVPFTNQLVRRLRDGESTLLEALEQPRLWVVDQSHSGELIAAVASQFADLPTEVLPRPGTMLLPSLEPILTLKAVGAAIREGRVPISAIKRLVEGSQKAMKLFAEYVLDEQMKTTGQTLVLLKGLFNLPAQRVAFGSFEISFRSPIADAELTSISAADMNLEKSALEEVGLMLRTGLEFLENADQGALNEPKTSEKDRVILQAMKYLTPSSQGPIQEIELGGNLLGTIARRHTLTRENRRTVNQALARSQATTHDREVIQKVGYIRELDKDRLTCILRESDTDIGTSFLLDEELLEDVVDVFSDNLLVRVIGLSVPLKDTILAIALERKTQ